MPSSSCSSCSVSEAAHWIWSDASGAGRNVFVLFRRNLTLSGAVEHADLCLFADARWRLWINGRIVAYGPGRFVPGHPAYDRVDLAAWLQPGDNCLLVEVWSPGCSTYQTMPESSGGFIAWGEICAGGVVHDLATGGAWLMRQASAWDENAPAYSFAQGPVEILDQRRLQADLAGPWLVPVARQNGPWGALAERTLPALDLTCDRARSLALVACLDGSEERRASRVRRPPGHSGKMRFAYAVTLHTTITQQVNLGLFWGPHWLDGCELTLVNHALGGNRQDVLVELTAGTHVLYGEPEALTEIWAQYLAWPVAAGLTVGPLRHGPLQLAATMPSATAKVPHNEASLALLLEQWPDDRRHDGVIPAREMAWDRVGRVLHRDLALDQALPLSLPTEPDSPGWVVVADLGGEFLGHVRVVIEAPAGTVIDIATDERRRGDGQLGFYASNPFVDGADRVILAGGRQEVELFHPHGGRWLQLTIRGAGRVLIHDLAVRRHQVPVTQRGSFSCADADFAWTWDTGCRTLQACVEDAFIDCPWRERGTYLGDALVESAALAAVDGDPAVARRSLELWAQGQLADGQMQACVPSWHRQPLPDFSLLWILLLHQLWARDGDGSDAARWWPVVERVLTSPLWQTDAASDGLWTAPAGMFVDWGSCAEDRSGNANTCLNALRLRALECAAELAQALGRSHEASAFTAQRSAVLEAFRRRLWLPAQGRFARRQINGLADEAGEALHANALVLAFGLADAAQSGPTLAHLERGLRLNAQRSLKQDGSGYLELYFLSFALEALYRHQRVELAEQLMRDHWRAMRQAGAWTFWECLRNGSHQQGSLCHAWSCTPLRWFHEQVLGVRSLPGDPQHLLIAPDSLLAWAQGVVPHPAGPVHVAWRRNGRILELSVSAPSAIELRIEPGPSFAGMQVRRSAGPRAESRASAGYSSQAT